MKRPEKKDDPIIERLRRIALRQPDTEEGIACAGTAAERRTIKIRNKAFLFLGAADAMLKLGDSSAEATKFSDVCRVGVGGWTKLTFGAGASLPVEVLERWVGESYRLLAPKTAQPASAGGAAKSKRPPKNARKKRK